MAHITGGGITDNLPRVLPHGTAALVRTSAWDVPPLFRWLQEAGRVPADDMLRTFNMGIGLIIVCRAAQVDEALSRLVAAGERDAVVIGRVEAGDQFVQEEGALFRADILQRAFEQVFEGAEQVLGLGVQQELRSGRPGTGQGILSMN